MLIGVVTEGPTDFLILDALILSLFPAAKLLHLHPGRVALQPLGTGWRGVERWCKEFCKAPNEILAVDRPLNMLVVHVDCSVARNFQIAMDCPPAQPTADALRNLVRTKWLAGAPEGVPIVVVTPSRVTDAWLLISLYPEYWPRGNPAVEIECDELLDGELVRRRLAKSYRGRAKKRPERYRAMTPHIRRMITTLRGRCPEARIFIDTLHTHLSA